ncbi:hypothetical protein J3R83DRAFT_13779 [Lanmaoa asiatica]|nr:hypothetical protein J3R83DRAFT_13779 [Lanmaoa asiatica]
MALESLTQNANIRDINPTTKRLVERCLSGEWCVHLRKSSFDKDALNCQGSFRQGSPSHDILASTTQASLHSQAATSIGSERRHDGAITPLVKLKQIKPCRSVENIKSQSTKPPPSRSGSDEARRPCIESATSLGVVASITTNAPRWREKTGSMDDDSLLQQAEKNLQLKHHSHLPPSTVSSCIPSTTSTATTKTRRPPPAPPKRRKPPSIPLGQTHGGALITAIASSSPSTHSQLGNKGCCYSPRTFWAMMMMADVFDFHPISAHISTSIFAYHWTAWHGT